MSGGRLDVSLRNERVISRFRSPQAPEITTLIQLTDGSILLCFELEGDETGIPASRDNLLSVTGAWLKSLDGGDTWFFVRHDVGHFRAPIFQFEDGEVLLLLQDCLATAAGEVYTLGERSIDCGHTLTAPVEIPIALPTGRAKLERPGTSWAQPSTPQSAVGRHGVELMINRSIIQMENGDLLANLCGAFKGDKKWRNIIIRSSDRGASWSYISTVASDPEAPPEIAEHAGYEGFNEAAIASLPNGELLIVMRTGSGFPMYQCRSVDEGVSWSIPESAGLTGVYPQLLLMSDGLLACSYGRVEDQPSRGVEISFSTDMGRSWRDRTVIHDGPSEGYTDMIEIRPRELLCLYDTQVSAGHEDEASNCAMAVNVEVERLDG
jgi:hypothetical protein